MTKNDQISQILSKVQSVPTLPATVLRVMQMVEDPLCSAADLAQVIQSDPALAIKVLKLANSAYYGFRQKIATVPQAITLLGFATLKNALLSAAVFDLFRINIIGFDLVGLWKHSIATATACRMLAKRVRYPSAEKAFTAGLLHDIGKVMIARYLPTSLQAIVQMMHDDQIPMLVAEQKTIGIGHPAFGAWVMSRWNLPTALVEAVEFHHTPTQSQYSFDLTAIVYLADILTHQTGLGNGGDNLARDADPQILRHFGLTDTGVHDLESSLLGKKLEIETFAAVASAA